MPYKIIKIDIMNFQWSHLGLNIDFNILLQINQSF